MNDNWMWIHAALWFAAFGNLCSAWIVEKLWNEGWWLKARPWFVRFCVLNALWDIYAAGAMIPGCLP